MSNVNNKGLWTLDEIRARRAQRGGDLGQVANQIVQKAVSAYEDSTPARADQPGGLFSPRLNPGELEEIEARLKATADGGTMADMRFIVHARADMEKLINTINALSRRVAKRFNEAAEARQEAAEARQEAAEARQEAALARERLEREVNRLTTELHQARTKIEEIATIRGAMARYRPSTGS